VVVVVPPPACAPSPLRVAPSLPPHVVPLPSSPPTRVGAPRASPPPTPTERCHIAGDRARRHRSPGSTGAHDIRIASELPCRRSQDGGSSTGNRGSPSPSRLCTRACYAGAAWRQLDLEHPAPPSSLCSVSVERWVGERGRCARASEISVGERVKERHAQAKGQRTDRTGR
jgi:hypothetical protein